MSNPTDNDPRPTLGEVIACHRMMAGDDFLVFWNLLSRNFCLDESVFQPDNRGITDPLLAAKRDGQRDVMNFIRNIRLAPTPAEDEPTENAP